MKTVLLILSAILVISFTGCTDCPEPIEPEIITNTVYINRILPTIQDKPKFVPYTTIMVNFNGEDYYAIPRIDGTILKNNWLQYKTWAEENYSLLKSLENNSTD